MRNRVRKSELRSKAKYIEFKTELYVVALSMCDKFENRHGFLLETWQILKPQLTKEEELLILRCAYEDLFDDWRDMTEEQYNNAHFACLEIIRDRLVRTRDMDSLLETFDGNKLEMFYWLGNMKLFQEINNSLKEVTE